MNNRVKTTAAGIAALGALALGGAAIAGATGGDEQESASGNLAADDAAHARKAALAETGGGEVNAVERDGENGATYEVEVTKPDGSTVDVRLDENFKTVIVEGDEEDGGND